MSHNHNDPYGKPPPTAPPPYPHNSSAYPPIHHDQQPPAVIIHHQPQPPQHIVVTPQPIIYASGCPSCRHGVMVNRFTCCGIFLGIIFFPIGLLCCYFMRERRCSNCGARF